MYLAHPFLMFLLMHKNFKRLSYIVLKGLEAEVIQALVSF